METITVKIEGRENVSFFISLLQKFNFIKEIAVNTTSTAINKDINEAPVEWANKKPSIDGFAGIWKDNPVTIDEMRASGWKRN
jgi:hypothetical protein